MKYYIGGTGDPTWLKNYPRDTAVIELWPHDDSKAWRWAIGAIPRHSTMTADDVDSMLQRHCSRHYPLDLILGWVCRKPREATMKKRTGNKAARVAAIDAAYKAGDADKLRKLKAKWPEEKDMIGMRLGQILLQEARQGSLKTTAKCKPPRCPRTSCGRAMRPTGYTRTVGVWRRKQYACDFHDEFAYGRSTRRKGKKTCHK